MPKGPEITDEIRMLIANLHKEHPKWTNRVIRNEVSSIVHKRNPSLPKGWPSKFAIDRIMPDIRERARQSKLAPNPIDQPWTIQSMSNSKYHIPPEALPAVLQVWFRAKQYEGQKFSIRHAQWVSRLYAAITDVETLLYYSFLATLADMLAEMAGVENFMGYEAVNLLAFSTMTGRAISSKEAKIVAGVSKEIQPKTVDPFAWVEGVFEAKGYLNVVRMMLGLSEEAKPKRKGGKK